MLEAVEIGVNYLRYNLAAESDRDFELGDFGNAARNDGDAMQARSVEQHAVNFIQGDGIHDVAGSERVGNGITFGGHGEWYETVLVLETDQQANEVGKVLRLNATVFQVLEVLVVERELADWGGHTSRSFLARWSRNSKRAQQAGVKKLRCGDIGVKLEACWRRA
jgi:hypothetical protein